MKSSVNIECFPAQSVGRDQLFLSVKNVHDNSTRSYLIAPDSLEQDLPNVLLSLSRDGVHWQVSSSRVNSHVDDGTTNVTSAVEECEANQPMNDSGMSVEHVPESFGCKTLPVWRQTLLMIRLTMLHPDRRAFILLQVLPIQAILIFLAVVISNFQSMRTALFPMLPLFLFIYSLIPVAKIPSMIALEKANGLVKLLTSQGVDPISYALSYLILSFVMSFVIPLAVFLQIGSKFGTSLSQFGLFLTYFAFWFMFASLNLLSGLLFSVNVGQIFVFVLLCAAMVFGMGTLNIAAMNSYPGVVGTTVGLFLIGDTSPSTWTKFVGPFIVNMVLGSIFLAIFVVYTGQNTLTDWLKSNLRRRPRRHSNHADEERGKTSTAILEGRNIHKVYYLSEQIDGHLKKIAFHALSDVSFRIEEGKLIGLIGLNGAGKSTLMDVLSGQTEVTNGEVYCLGKKVNGPEVSANVSLCGQVDQLWPKMPVKNAIKLFMKIRGYSSKCFDGRGEICDPYVKYLITSLKLQDQLALPNAKLSGGQKRRLSFLISLLGSTKAVLVDEALTGVDYQSRVDMWRTLKNEVALRRRSVVVTTHDISEIEQHCNHVGILHHGKLLAYGDMQSIRRKWTRSSKLTLLFAGEGPCDLDSLMTVNDSDKSSEDGGVWSVSGVVRESLCETPAKALVTCCVQRRNSGSNDEEGSEEILKVCSSLFQALLMKQRQSMSADGNLLTLLWWSFEPFGLEDFVRAQA